MKITEIRRRARALGLTGTERMKPGELIRRIQRAEGNFDCYAAAARHACQQNDCCWRSRCLSAEPE
ncbi:MAG: SAP domain-containing protein [Desulfuromonadales bacterium]|nr:SAP domain-containing protein [Desulfuromonadales bacterium]